MGTLYRLIGIKMVYGSRGPSASQEQGKHTVVPAMDSTGEHPAVTFRQLINLQGIGGSAATTEVRLDEQDQSALVGCRVPTVGSLLALVSAHQDIPFDGLISTFENNRIVFVRVSIDYDFLVITVPVVGTFGRLDIVFPIQGHCRGKRNIPGSIP